VQNNRDLPGLGVAFDRVVSVGMVEHVGRDNYEQFLSCAKSILKPGGLFLLHYISSLKEYPGDPWIKKYIFPGGVIPSLREILQIAGDLRFFTLDVESLRRHYSKTLRCWNENYQQHREEVVTMFDEPFARMWELYLCACAATFMNGIIDLHQILFTNDINNELPMTRWY
jgi:cyclopropane-fatty-acyl-phospholipid synthase